MSPLEKIELPVLNIADVQLYLKREDLIHPLYGGNKIRKLKYNVQECKRQHKTGLLTCGGAYSNHILAVAAYGKEAGLKTKGIIRGEELLAENPTLKDAVELGMEMVFVSRDAYKALRENPSIAFELSNSTEDNYFYVPEGGTNKYAVEGVAEIIAEIDIPFDFIATPCGTGGTFAGLMSGLKNKQAKLLVYAALKGGVYLIEEVKQLLGEEYDESKLDLFTTDFCFGGYAKMKPELKTFIHSFYQETGVLLDPIYNGKMMYGLISMIKKEYFKKGSVIIALHTGGVQAWRGYG